MTPDAEAHNGLYITSVGHAQDASLLYRIRNIMGRRLTTPHPREASELAAFGQQLRARRKRRGLSMDAVAMAAGISRVTLYRVEKGEGSVTWAAVWRVAVALGAQLALEGQRPAGLPDKIRLSDYPGLSRLGWQLSPDTELSPAETWSLLSREWRHVDPVTLTKADSVLLEQLEETFGELPRA